MKRWGSVIVPGAAGVIAGLWIAGDDEGAILERLDAIDARLAAMESERAAELCDHADRIAQLESDRGKGSARVRERKPTCAWKFAPREDEVPATPIQIPIVAGARGFLRGDSLEVAELWGDRAAIEAGGTYALTVRYALGSAHAADVSVSATGGVIDGPNQTVTVAKGSGQVRVWFRVVSPGELHVSYYPLDPPRHGFGGAYFADEGGALRTSARWYEALDGHERLPGVPQDFGVRDEMGASPPRCLFAPAAMKADFAAALERLGVETELLEVDDSEFPPMIYGIAIGSLEGSRGIKQLVDQLPRDRYSYNGCVTWGLAGSRTAFSVNAVAPNMIGSVRQTESMIRLVGLADRAERELKR